MSYVSAEESYFCAKICEKLEDLFYADVITRIGQLYNF